ncbi:sigma factor-like helix-turn-helix DNA-binding protein, partial [Bacteroides fragilis]|uniref:sigma factor-like helix-turn-helix DNA-binding protein n=1 Tax=Bacteroides fragilis TaxID=817 RepID=UPI00200FD183
FRLWKHSGNRLNVIIQHYKFNTFIAMFLIISEIYLFLFRTHVTLKTLLFTIVKNKALNKISHFEIKRKVHQEIAEKYETEFSSPDFYLENELFRLYEEALRKLPAEFRQAYEMNRSLQMTHKEIAEKLNVSPQTINYRIGQALKILRSELKDYLPLIMLFLFLQGHK